MNTDGEINIIYKQNNNTGRYYSNKFSLQNVFNETWLKKSILDNEVLPDNYKIFRLDRSLKTHQCDPTQPKKFKKNGGGVLIGHRSDFNITSNVINTVNAHAELLSVMFKLPSGKEYCISTFYRVGTLGVANFNEFSKYFKLLDQHILIGDMNLSNVLWPDGHSSCSTHSYAIHSSSIHPHIRLEIFST